METTQNYTISSNQTGAASASWKNSGGIVDGVPYLVMGGSNGEPAM